MKTRQKLAKLSSLALCELLRIGTEDERDEMESERDDGLRRQSVDALLSEPSPVTMANTPQQTTLDCLLDSHQSASTCELLKEYYKQATTSWESEARADAARVLYYAAIAAAIVYHGHIITQLEQEERINAFTYLADVFWMPGPLVGLFHDATRVLQQTASERRRGTQPGREHHG